ncbi:hypothetical protein CapIbe_006946 [Capra ibex]
MCPAQSPQEQEKKEEGACLPEAQHILQASSQQNPPEGPLARKPEVPSLQVSGTRSSPPAPLPPPGSGSPVTPRALPRRLVGSSLRAPTVPPPLPPVAPQPARHQSRHSPASPSPASPGPASLSPVTLSLPAHVDLGAATEEGEGPEAAGRAPTAPVIPPQAQPRSLASETN